MKNKMGKKEYEDFEYSVYEYINDYPNCSLDNINIAFEQRFHIVAKAVNNLLKQDLIRKNTQGCFYPTPWQEMIDWKKMKRPDHEKMIDERQEEKSDNFKFIGLALGLGALGNILFSLFLNGFWMWVFRGIAIFFLVAGIIMYIKGVKLEPKKENLRYW